jgi:2-polyprenyl-3-methyl-5-hydroxy-6-metoxy-1,4-benzoquinol methylase
MSIRENRKKTIKNRIVEDTIKSFDYQWTHLSDSQYILNDENWKKNVDEYILDEISISKDQIKSKTVIDIGCGGGRWTYGFAKLGCTVTAVDVSEGPARITKEFVPTAEVIVSDLFDLYTKLKGRTFDIVWCWGVIHHTGDPKKAFDILFKLMHPQSMLHLYVYSFDRGIRVKTLRKIMGFLSLPNREKAIKMLIKMGILHGSVHELFDTLSTQINFEISEEELKKWFSRYNLTYHRYTPQWVKESRDLFVTGKRPA